MTNYELLGLHIVYYIGYTDTETTVSFYCIFPPYRVLQNGYRPIGRHQHTVAFNRSKDKCKNLFQTKPDFRAH